MSGLHALTDALLGAIGAGDIGMHFPPSDPRWRGAASDRFLRHAAALVRDKGGAIAAVDVTIICERPKIAPHRAAMVERVAAILGDRAGAGQRQGDDDRTARLYRPRRRASPRKRSRPSGCRYDFRRDCFASLAMTAFSCECEERSDEAISTRLATWPDARLGLPLWHPAALIATGCGIGLLPWAPGSWGSLAALPCAWAICALLGRRRACRRRHSCLCAGLLGVGGGRAASGRKDPGFIVIDEVAAQWLVLLAAPLDWRAYLAAFVLFRVFDI